MPTNTSPPPDLTTAFEAVLEMAYTTAAIAGVLVMLYLLAYLVWAYLIYPRPTRASIPAIVATMGLYGLLTVPFWLSPASPDVAWSALAWILSGVVLAAGAGAGAYLGRSLPRRAWQGLRRRWSARRARAAERAEQTRAEEEYLSELTGRHDRVREAWASYQLDLEKFLDAPALADVAVEPTAVFVRAMSRAQDRRPGAAQRPDHYGEAVYALESAWERARAHRVGAGYLTDPQRFDRAASLLRLAHGEHAGGAHERQQALDKAHKLLSPLVSPPEPLHQELDHRVRTALEA